VSQKEISKEQVDLFHVSKVNKLSKARLHKLRDMVIFKNSPYLNKETFEKAYNKYKKYVNYKWKNLLHKSDEELSQIMMACAYNYYLNKDHYLKQRPDANTRDLTLFLDTRLSKAYDRKNKMLLKNKLGIVFLNYFVKEFIIATRVDGKEDKSVLKTSENWKQLYRTTIKTVYLGDDPTPANIFSTLRFSDGAQIPSNFRPLSAGWIFYNYGFLPNKDKTKDIYLHCSSEGFLGRLLSTFYIAYHNPNYNIHYYTIDPNINVVKAFDEVVEFLKDYGKVKNWFPKIFNIGSEQDEADFYKLYGKKFHVSFTSPPYFNLEKYAETYTIQAVLDIENKTKKEYYVIDDKKENITYIEALKLYRKGNTVLYKDNNFNIEEKHSESDKIEIIDRGQYRQELASKLKIGDKIKRNNLVYKIIKVNKVGQSMRFKSYDAWNEYFLRPTVKNIYNCLNDSCYLLLNVVNIKTHPTLENDTIRIAKENNFKHIDTLKFKIQRVPGSVKLKDGSTVLLKEFKKDWEPIFVFQKGEDKNKVVKSDE